MLRIVAWLAVCLWMGASDELSFVEEEDLALEDEGQVISHDDVMRAAESVAREKYEHSFSFMDLENWDGSLAALVLQHRSAAAFVLYFHKPSCEHCERFSPILSDAVDRFGEASPGAEVLWVGINCDESGFEDLGELYEIVEFPTMMLIEDMYSEPFKYEGGWKSASEVVDYVAAFADVHDCAEATHEVVVSGARITLGGAMTSNQRALSWVEATRAVAKLGEATDATVTVACADSGSGLTVHRAFEDEAYEVEIDVPTAYVAEHRISAQRVVRERLRRAASPGATEIVDRTAYGTMLGEVDSLGLLTIRPNTTRAKVRKTLDAARKLMLDVPVTTSFRLAYCELGSEAASDEANYLCDEMAQYTLPRFKTSGGQGFVIMDMGPRMDPPVSCRAKADAGATDDDDDSGLTDHMRKILAAKELARKTKGAKQGILRRFALHRSFTRKAAAAFVADYANEDLDEATLSDKIPEAHENPGPFFMLVGDTFPDFVNTTKDVLIYVVQNQCLACHQMWAAVNGVVEFFAGQPNIKFGAIDNRINDILVKPWTLHNATPSILFLPGGKTEEDDLVSIPYKITSDQRGEDRAILDTKAMIQTILDRATGPFNDKADLLDEVNDMAHSA